MRTREQHLEWCKQRAVEILERGDVAGACASMISDLGKWEQPLYSPTVLRLLATHGMLFCHSPDQMRGWIVGFA